MDVKFVPDDCQEKVINVSGGFHLVLAPPGCGKTQILAERISRAHGQGVDFDDMLCLTFTNRAAREMRERIRRNSDNEIADSVYIGNVHRFCSKFLFENGIVAAETSVIDDDDAISILARHLNDNEDSVRANASLRRRYSEAIHLCAFMHQIRHRHDRLLRVHPECFNRDDVEALKGLCKLQKREFDAETMLDVYDHVDFYRSAIYSPDCPYCIQEIAAKMLLKMEVAHAYDDYKRKNSIIDFADLLLLAYDALRSDTEGIYKRYHWVQVDEVQDLNALQLEIIDHLTASTDGTFTCLYLGDEQQAIFSFMGAKVATLDKLRMRCGENVHHLFRNHRSPQYLLSVFNTYANSILGIDSALLPSAANDAGLKGRLEIVGSVDIDAEYTDAAQLVRSILDNHSDETVAVIVNSNSDADAVSEALAVSSTPHFKVSGEDIFSTLELKTLFSHMRVLADQLDFIAWARLLRGFRVFDNNAFSRAFVREMLDRAMTPADFLFYDGTTYVQEFVSRYEEGEVVVFDTETTGLDILSDDIVQIAAVKVRRGKVVEGSHFNVFMATDREIPLKLGDIDNPIMEEMRRHELHSHADGLRMFIEYAGGDVLLGHNSDFDYNILDNNLRRYLPTIDLRKVCPECFDTLLLSRLLVQGMVSYKLKDLLATLHLQGNNAHLADEDVAATCSLAAHCLTKAKEIVGSQREFMARNKVRIYVEKLRKAYAHHYIAARRRLYGKCEQNEQPLVAELRRFYEGLVDEGAMRRVGKMEIILNYLSTDIVTADSGSTLVEQLRRHGMELVTLKESDLCGSSAMTERAFVSTVHKAKGLEFDNVIVFDAIDGRYPSFFNRDNKRLREEDSRKFYVALTRARKNIFVMWSQLRRTYNGAPQQRNLTPFMTPIMKFFTVV